MQRLGLAELVGRVNFDPLAPHVAGDTAKAGSDGELWGPYTIEILIVGEADWSKPARDAMRAMQPFRLCTANDPRALWLIPGHQPVNVIVLHNTLTTIELEKTSRLIRHRWPHARILVVRTGDEFLEDALYDDRVLPTVDPATLIATIERLAENGREGRSRHGDQ
jgi:hypothetical protein